MFTEQSKQTSQRTRQYESGLVVDDEIDGRNIVKETDGKAGRNGFGGGLRVGAMGQNSAQRQLDSSFLERSDN